MSEPWPLVDAATEVGDRRERDVSTLRRRLAALERQHEILLRANKAVVYDWDIQRNRVRLSRHRPPPLSEMLAEVLLPSEWPHRIHADDRSEYRRRLSGHLKGETDRFEFEYRFRTRRGDWRWLRHDGVALRREDGRASRMEGLIADVTDERDARDALEAKERRFQDFAEVATDWFWESDAEHRLTYISNQVEEATGIAPAWFIGRAQPELLTYWASIAPDQVSQHLELLERGRSFRNFEYRFQRPDGEVRHVRYSGKALFDTHGRFAGYRGVGSDVTSDLAVHEPGRRTCDAEERLVAAMDRIGDFVALWDSQDRLVIANAQFRHSFPVFATAPGVSFETWLRAAHEQGCFAASVDEASLRRRIAYHRNPAGSLEMELCDGRWVMVTEHRLPDGGILTVTPEITAMKRVEGALRDSEERFRIFAEVSSDWFWEMDSRLRYTYVSERYEAITGRRRSAIIGRTRQEMYRGDFEEDRPAWCRLFADLDARRPVRSFTYRYRRDDGTVIVLRNNANPVFDAAGRFKGYRGVGIDITAEMEAQQEKEAALQRAADAYDHLHAAIRSIPEGFALYDRNDRLLLCNEAYWEIWSGDSRDFRDVTTYPELLNRAWDKGLIPPMKKTRAEWVDEQMHLFRIAHGVHERRLYNGRWLSILEQRTQDGDIAVVAADITPLKEAEFALKEQADELARSNTELARFADIVAHDLSTPLITIGGFVGLMRNRYGDRLDERALEYLDFIGSGVDRMTRLINDLLQYARVRAVNQRFADIDLEAVFAEARRDLAAAIAEAGAAIASEPLPRIRGDATLLRQLFQNLLGNAIKYRAPQRDLQIRISCRSYREDDPRHPMFGQQLCMIRVEDNGIGFAPEAAKVIFEPFRRLVTEDEAKGSGIGLAVCQNIVERHCGTISVEGVPDEGAAFTVVLPVQQAAALPPPPA